jgi:hypothetical protein
MEKHKELLRASQQIMHRFEIDEEEWAEKMIEIGCQFAEMFSRLFPNRETIKTELLKKKGDGDGRNDYWQWWKFKWMQDDMAFVQSSMYYENLRYGQLKEAMIGDEMLEHDLLQFMEHNMIF